MLNLSMLTRSGWLVFVAVLCLALTFVARLVLSRRNSERDRADITAHAIVLSIGLAFLLWLVTP